MNRIVVSVRLTSLVTLSADVESQDDRQMDRENVSAVRLQLRRFAQTGEFVPPFSSEPPISDPDMLRQHHLTLTRAHGGGTLRGRKALSAAATIVARKVARRG